MRSFWSFVLLAPMVSGCLSASTEGTPDLCRGDGPQMWGALDGRTVTDQRPTGTDPRQAWQTVMALRGDPAFGLAVEGGEANVTVEWLGNGTQRLGILSQEGPAQEFGVTVTVGGVDCRRFPASDWYPAEPREGAIVETGKGALVYTAGFLEDGTLFYTNDGWIEGAADRDEPWPRVDWYSFASNSPLLIYVYDGDRSEMPPQWGAGNNFDDERTDSLGFHLGSSLPGRYFTTIPGFNDALKGLSTSTVKVVRLAPEDAYTRPGNEDHPLYGQALVFLIQVEAVADQPCPLDLYYWQDGPAPYGTLGSSDCFRK